MLTRIILLNPEVTAVSDETDEPNEGCLSFFDVRGMVPRPLRMDVTVTALDGSVTTMTYEFGLARLIAHEIDHLGQHALHRPHASGRSPDPR
ncbi:peptide deformylase [Kitasatospora sp. NPDC050463]|uniref:peptide deformylase n=1 Tax=Kitasatospora sp. NPDC050463 TaxID=3155786 RepID=UPI0033E351FD